MSPSTAPALRQAGAEAQHCAASVLIALSVSHLLNDSIQAVLPAVYPLFKDAFHLSFAQIGMITLTFQMIGSIFQPLVGLYTDRQPRPYSLVFGMSITLGGLIILAAANSYPVILLATAMIGLGSAIFHPESSRMARLASGGRHGLAQSVFQVGGNAGTAAGPLLAAWIVVPHGQRSILVFAVLAFCGMVILSRVGRWYSGLISERQSKRGGGSELPHRLGRSALVLSLAVLLALMFSKFFYLACMTSYYTFYLMQRFSLSIQASQYCLFLFLFASAAGTLAGGILGDRFGRKGVIWVSILGAAPFSLLLPHANLAWTAVLSIAIGFVMAWAFPAILVYATELWPGKVGLVAGLFFGLAFGLAGVGSALLGKLADATSITFVMVVCSFLPLIGLVTVFLPDSPKLRS